MSSDSAAPLAADPALEARVQKLAAELRCLVCQNQTIADSNAALAVDLKNQVREQLRAGRSEDEVMRFMSERYGDFVHYRPPLKATTVALWSAPALLVAGGAWLLWRSLARRRQLAELPAPSDEQRERAQALLGRDG